MNFYSADFRLREFIVKCLKFKITQSAKSAIKHISPRNTALQLALSHHIGLGTIKDDKQATLILTRHSLEYTDLQNQVLLINDNIRPFWDIGGLLPILAHQGYIKQIEISLPQYYREKELLRKAEISHEHELKGLQLVFGQSHRLHLLLRHQLANIKYYQGRWNEAEELQVQVMETILRVLEAEHPDTLSSMGHLASTYINQER